MASSKPTKGNYYTDKGNEKRTVNMERAKWKKRNEQQKNRWKKKQHSNSNEKKKRRARSWFVNTHWLKISSAKRWWKIIQDNVTNTHRDIRTDTRAHAHTHTHIRYVYGALPLRNFERRVKLCVSRITLHLRRHRCECDECVHSARWLDIQYAHIHTHTSMHSRLI